MKVKELIKKYPHHNVIFSGFRKEAHFTKLPKELNGKTVNEIIEMLLDREVDDYDVDNIPFRNYDGQLIMYIHNSKGEHI